MRESYWRRRAVGRDASGVIARAVDDTDADARRGVELLDAIPGAHDRAQLGVEQARRGETVALDEL